MPEQRGRSVPQGGKVPQNPDGDAAPAEERTLESLVAVRAAVHSPEEPYLLLPAGFDVHCVSRQNAAGSIRCFVEGCLTPVLGSEITDALTVPGQGIVRDLLLEESFAARPELRRFHKALFDQRLMDREHLLGDHQRATERRPADVAVADLRLAMLEAAYQATVLYAALWSESVLPLSDRNAHEVTSAAGESHASFEPLAEALEAAVKALESFSISQTVELEDVDHRNALLGATGLSSRLRHLGEVISRDKSLHCTTVEWLTDVLWHVLTFDSPCYPSREDLALQVSLAEDSETPVQKVELTALTPAGIFQDWEAYGHALSRTLQGLRGADRPVPAVGPLHRALSASLYRSFDKWRGQASQPAGRRAPAPIALAITLTTDLELERALATDDGGSSHYHVAFPMILTNANHNYRGHLRWVVGKFAARLDQTDPGFWDSLTRPVGPWRLLNDVAEEFVLSGFNSALPGGLAGPLLLKVNGSPLHVIDPELAENPSLRNDFEQEISGAASDRVAGRRGGRAMHVPATTELDILQLTQVDQWAMGASNGRAGLPTIIRKALEEPTRRWLIVGHDLPEWSSRLQLYTQISLSSLAQRSQQGSVVPLREAALAVVRKADEQRTRLLAGMDIPLTDYTQLDPSRVATAIMDGLFKRRTR